MKIGKSDTVMRFVALVLCAAPLACHSTVARAQTASAKVGSNKSYAIDVAGIKEWVDTKIDVRGGSKLRFTATGKIAYPADASYSGRSRTLGTFGPDGLARGFADLIHQYAVGDAGHWALIGRIG